MRQFPSTRLECVCVFVQSGDCMNIRAVRACQCAPCVRARAARGFPRARAARACERVRAVRARVRASAVFARASPCMKPSLGQQLLSLKYGGQWLV